MVVIKNFSFESYISAELIDNRVGELSKEIRTNYEDKNPIFLGILKGCFVFMADLVRTCQIRSEVEFVQCATYHGFERSDEVDIISFFDVNRLKGRHIIIAEDIVDSGHTVGALIKKLEELECASIYLTTLLYKPAAFIGPHKPDLVGFEIPNDFVIGYGLDYDGQGRELRDIYVKSE